MKYNIVAEYYMPHEMAQVKVNNRVVFIGNLWDFHPGCCGTKITVGYGTKNPITLDLKGVWDGKCTAVGLGSLISLKLNQLGHKTQVSTIFRKTPIEC